MSDPRRGLKRCATVPREARLLAVSKADLLEVAWRFASAAHDGGCDDNDGTLARLVEEINIERDSRGAKRIPIPHKKPIVA